MKRELIFKTGNFDIRLDLIFIIVTFIMLVTGYLTEFIIALTSIFLHELGHILTAMYFGCKLVYLRVLPVGLNAALEDNMCRFKEKLLIYFIGPFVNILLALLALLISLKGFYEFKYINFFISVNAYLAAFNLLPALPLDGGKILRDILVERFGIFFASRLLKRISIFFSSFVLLIGIFQLLQNKHNFSLIIIGFYILSSSNFKEMEAAIMNIKSVVYRRSRLLKKGIYPARDLVVVKSMPMSELLKNMDFDRFHIIHVLDEELKLLKIYTEQEIIDGMLKYDTDMTFEEFIKKSS